MNLDEHCDLMHYIQEGRWWFTRRPAVLPTNDVEALRTIRLLERGGETVNIDSISLNHLIMHEHMTEWQAAKVLNINPMYIHEALLELGVQAPHLKTEAEEMKALELSSPLFPFDGAGTIFYHMTRAGIERTSLAAALGIKKSMLDNLLAGRRRVEKQQLFDIADLLSIDLEQWKNIDFDVRSTFNGSILDTCPLGNVAISGAPSSEIGPWAKQKNIIIRINMALMRLHRYKTVRDCAAALNILDWQYVDIEMCLDEPSPEILKKLAVYLGVKQPIDLLIPAVVPVNYNYILQDIVAKGHRAKLI